MGGESYGREQVVLAWRLIPLGLLVAMLEQVGRPLAAMWPRRDADISWMVGLQLMRTFELPFGADGVFTYGPWGFLSAPTGIDLSDLWLSGLVRVLVVLLLFLGIRGCLPDQPWRIPVAVPFTLLVANCSQTGWALTLALSAIVLAHLAASRTPDMWTVGGLSALAALSAQIKLSDGLLSIAVVGLLVLTTRSPRTWLISVLVFTASFIGLWLGAGQALTDLPGWSGLALDIVVGYGEAMAFTHGSWIVWVLVVGAVMAVVAVLAARHLPLAAKVAALGITLFATKAALTRPDAPHLLPGYAALALVLVVALVASVPVAVRVLAMPVAAGLTLLLMVPLPILPPRQWSPSALPLDALPAEHSRRIERARADVIAELNIAPHLLEELKGHPVSIDPWEISVAWAHDLDWSPLPVFQSYSVYTARLDEANAAALLEDRDHRVLRENAPYVDDYPLWNSPATTLAMVCNFSVVAQQAQWSVLARDRPRCGDEKSISTSRVRAGETVELPSSDDAIVAVRYDPDARSGADRLMGVTGYQRNLLHASLDDVQYRIPEALAGGPLIVGAPPDDLALLGNDPASTIAFSRAGQLEIVEIALAQDRSWD